MRLILIFFLQNLNKFLKQNASTLSSSPLAPSNEEDNYDDEYDDNYDEGVSKSTSPKTLLKVGLFLQTNPISNPTIGIFLSKIHPKKTLDSGNFY